jgi:glycine cleavage system aminomethyltransferase T
LNTCNAAFPNLSSAQASVAHAHAIVLREDIGSIPAFHLLVGRDYAESLCESIVHAGHEFHFCLFGLQTLQLLQG